MSSPAIGVYGWRKRCIYCVLSCMLVATILNMAATLVLINIIHFNLGGLGKLSISASGVFLRDLSNVLNTLVASHLTSRPGEPLTLESLYNMTAVIRDKSGGQTQFLHFWTSLQEGEHHQAVTATASQFRVTHPTGKAMFFADEEEVVVGTDVLEVLEGGVHFSGSIQTSMVRSKLGTELLLESITRGLKVKAAKGIILESRASDISASCHSKLLLCSTGGQVKLKAPGIYLPYLSPTVTLHRPALAPLRPLGGLMSNSYQVCMCTSGKLFAAHPHGECHVDIDNAQCR